MTKRNNKKAAETIHAVQSGPAVKIEYPREREALTHPTYTFRIAAVPGATDVEVSIDNGDWRPCREALGLWWYDWSDYAKGKHALVARSRIADGISALSHVRHFTVA